MRMEKTLKKILNLFCPWYGMDKKMIKLYKKSHNYAKKNNKILARYYYYKIIKKYNCIISPSCHIGEGIKMPHPMNIVIGSDAIIGNNVTIYHGVTIGQNKGKFPIIGDNVIIYADAKVIGNVKVGNNVVIGANSVVTHDIPDNKVVVGSPAKEIKY